MSLVPPSSIASASNGIMSCVLAVTISLDPLAAPANPAFELLHTPLLPSTPFAIGYCDSKLEQLPVKMFTASLPLWV